LPVERIEPPENGFDPDDFARVKGARLLGPLDRQVLRELFILREGLAEQSDQPPFRIMNPETLIELAQRKPRHRAELADVRGFPSKQIRRLGDEVLDAIARGVEKGPLRKMPQLASRDGTSHLTEEEVELHERLKQWRKNAAQSLGIDSAYLLNRHVLLRLAKEQPLDIEAVAGIEGMQPWQIDRHAEEIAQVIRRFVADVRSGAWQPRRRRPLRNGDARNADAPAEEDVGDAGTGR
jgi:ribonuclease D